MNVDERLYVLAGNHREFQQWCADRDIGPNDRRVRCICTSTSMLGADHGMWYIKIGTWERRMDLPRVMQTLATCGAREAVTA